LFCSDCFRDAKNLVHVRNDLRERLDEPVSWEQKRRLIEVLVAGVRVDTVEESGVKQTRTTVTYRFSEPDQPMRLVLPQSYSTGRENRIPVAPRTVGDHILKRRLALKMLQRDVAEQLGVDKTSIFNWEANTSAPEIRYMPVIIDFLGYNRFRRRRAGASGLSDTKQA
jgi:DNA-binding XRE family transcriptional regulator